MLSFGVISACFQAGWPVGPYADRAVQHASFGFVRHNDANETALCAMKNVGESLERLRKRSNAFRTKTEVEGDEEGLRSER